MKPFLSILLCAVLFLTTSCDETKKVINTASNVQLNGNYTINFIKEKDFNTKQLTLSFEALNKSVNATTECNNLFGSYTIDLYTINFNPLASTKMFCEGKMKAEKEIAQALENTGSFTLENGVLKFFAKTDKALLLTATKEK